jgi:hypothetical protein
MADQHTTSEGDALAAFRVKLQTNDAIMESDILNTVKHFMLKGGAPVVLHGRPQWAVVIDCIELIG